MKSISRSTGRTAIAAAAYRSGERLHDNQTGQTHDYTRKRGVETRFIVAPENAPERLLGNEALWNEAQAKDNRKNSCLAREIELALPSEIDAAGRAELARDFSLHLVERYGVAVSAAVHEPGRHGDENNYHAHILLTTRRMDENGLGAKTRELDALATRGQEVEHIREYAASLINAYLEDVGSDERVDHRSYKDRGIDQVSTEHLGVAAAAMERKGELTRIGDENRKVTERNRTLDRLVSELVEVEVEITRGLDTQFQPEPIENHTEAEPERPASVEELIASFTGTETSEAVRLAMSGEAADTQHPASMETIIQSYENAADLRATSETEQNNRAWYENLYYNTVETVLKYYTSFVDRINAERNRNGERGYDEREPDEYERDR